MSETTWKRNTAGSAAHAQRCNAHTHKGVEDAITPLPSSESRGSFTFTQWQGRLA